MVFIAITLSEFCFASDVKRVVKRMRFTVTEVYYLNVALALFNTGGSYSCVLLQKRADCVYVFSSHG